MVDISLKTRYVTYSYQAGILNILQIIAGVSIFALISMIISLIIGIRKKDCLAILVTNIMVKTVTIFLYQISDRLLYLDDVCMVILFFIATIIIEGLIYGRVLKYKKQNGIIVSAICNIGTILMFRIFSSRLEELLYLLF